MLLVEEFALLTLTPEGKFRADATHLEYALAGSVLLELAMKERVAIHPPPSRFSSAQVVVTDASPLEDPLLTESLARLHARGPVRAGKALDTLKKGLKARVLAGLIDNGYINVTIQKVMWIFTSARHIPTPAVPYATWVPALTEAVRSMDGDEDTVARVSMLVAADALHKVVDQAQLGMTTKEIKTRGKELASRHWAADVTKVAIEQVQAAIIAATTAATVAAVSSS